MNNTWTLAVGAWGDSLCAYGNICSYIKENGLEKCNVVYFGLDKNICEFFKSQPNIDKVSFLDISIPSVVAKYIELANTDFPEWMKVTELDQQLPGLVQTHISRDWHKNRSNECYRDFDCQLPPCLADYGNALDEPFTLFQPFSTNSCGPEYHWPHWEEVFNWLIENEDRNIVIVGETQKNLPNWLLSDNPKVKNLIGQTKSMLDVFHIANNADRIITTSNSLSVWSAIKQIPAVVVCNKVIQADTPYYYNWINSGKNIVLNYNSPFDEFASI